MSSKPTVVTDELNNYLEENFSSEDVFLKKLNKAAKAKGMPDIRISGNQGKFLQFMLKSINAQNVLEIGALAGYSAITMGRALPDNGKLITVEKEKDYADFVKIMVDEAGLTNKITVINDDGRKFVENFNPDYKLDFVFVDADKPGYFHYLTHLAKHIRKGGIFAADNAFAFGFLLDTAPERDPEDIRSIKSFNNAFNQHPDFEVAFVPIGDGLIMGIKK